MAKPKPKPPPNEAASDYVPPWETLEFVTSAFQPDENGTSEHPTQHIEYASINNLKHDALSSPDLEKSPNPPRKPTLPRSSSEKSTMDNIARINRLIASSKSDVKNEHRLTLTQAFKLYPKAIGWSMLLSLTIVMEGYDLTIINSFYAFPQFRQSYGVESPPGSGNFQITTAWQSGLTNGAIVGEILGLLGNGYLTERWGYKKTLVGSLIALCGFIFLAVFAQDVGMLMASEVLCGLSWGVFQTLSTTYAAEIMPVALRAYLTSNVNLCWLLGQICGTGVLRGLIHLDSAWSYRIPFSLQWMWALPILVGVVFAPESPWWLVRHGEVERAKMALMRVTRRGMEGFDADETIRLMRRTNELEGYLAPRGSVSPRSDTSEETAAQREKRRNMRGTGYLDCFRGTNLRRTEIACVVWMIQTLCGSPLTGYAAYFYVQAGFEAERAFDLSLGMYGMAILGGMISWFLMPHVGRRTLYLWGCALMLLLLLIGGAVGCVPDAPGGGGSPAWVSWVLGSGIIAFTFVYDTTVGPVCYSLVAEIPSSRLRVKTVVLARVAYNLVGIVSNVLMPKMLNPTAWNWKGKTCLLWAGTCALCWLWCYWRLPEPKGLTYLELDLLFEKKVKARKFGKIKNVLDEAGYFEIMKDDGGARDWRGVLG